MGFQDIHLEVTAGHGACRVTLQGLGSWWHPGILGQAGGCGHVSPDLGSGLRGARQPQNTGFSTAVGRRSAPAPSALGPQPKAA